jgi:hypothetical protein
VRAHLNRDPLEWGRARAAAPHSGARPPSSPSPGATGAARSVRVGRARAPTSYRYHHLPLAPRVPPRRAQYAAPESRGAPLRDPCASESSGARNMRMDRSMAVQTERRAALTTWSSVSRLVAEDLPARVVPGPMSA